MEEKIIIQSKIDKKKKNIFLGILIGSTCLFVIQFISTYISALGSNFGVSFNLVYSLTKFISFYTAIFCGIVAITTLIIFLPLLNNELTVSNVKITGKTRFGKSVELPVDMISAVATSKFFSKISISTSSGLCNFALVGNYTEINQVINQLIIERKNTNFGEKQTIINNNISHADELKKYKDLLDAGIITQEEFDAKKKKLLGL